MVLQGILFFIAAAGAIGGAVAVVLLRNPFFSVLALVCHLFALAVLFLLLYAQFIAAAQLIVYAGAVMVLYVFVVSYVGGADEPIDEGGGAPRALAPIFAGALLVVLALALAGSALTLLDTNGAKLPDNGNAYGTPEQIGELLLTKYLLPFEVASFLLTVAAVCAVVLARRRRGLEELTDDSPLLGEGLGKR
ncbi:MAG: NADH-quinone oxidoreductase subunit J [Thermoleophilaceae bacterium]|nr:NADH-quinone oxidoreductase subunit J [Thermoleophilaceae bacterium]